ncbi:uncharacterized protein H6S33_003070 [Morchella sextelata]|uniref:uncharacterized protein n=1 Tax=Morchella sextelata TaxID=1174677 RepID=UPI001D047B0B|nr:uncharacterized protein H6S33_003070 [Morchella sextelata]KAH0607082.1 hypothetical protein H6S33_003070 [Morchella sextelata]
MGLGNNASWMIHGNETSKLLRPLPQNVNHMKNTAKTDCNSNHIKTPIPPNFQHHRDPDTKIDVFFQQNKKISYSN